VNTYVLGVLNGPRLIVDGQAVAMPESCLRLLVYLAFRRRPAPRRAVAAVLWPDSSEARAGGNVRSAMWRLRAAGATVRDGPGGLMPGPGLIMDLDEVAGWAGRLLTARDEDGDLRVPDDVDAALDLLPAWCDDWVVFERERVRDRVLRALELVSARLSARDRHAEAVDAAIAAVYSEPLRESAQRALLQAHLAEGNQVEAHRAYRAYAKLLDVELGLAPSPGLHDLLLADTEG
jgi:DNA-binding SARP family transcriptional activator